MYLDPCVSINCKYKLDKIFDLIWSFNMVSEVKESSDDLWTIFQWYLDKIRDKIQPILRTLQWYKVLFFPRGEIPGYRHTQVAEKYIDTHIMKGKEKEESNLVQAAHRHNPYGKSQVF